MIAVVYLSVGIIVGLTVGGLGMWYYILGQHTLHERKFWYTITLHATKEDGEAFTTLLDKASGRTTIAPLPRCGTICPHCGFCLHCYTKDGVHACVGDSTEKGKP
jgi:hypothetical protein